MAVELFVVSSVRRTELRYRPLEKYKKSRKKKRRGGVMILHGYVLFTGMIGCLGTFDWRVGGSGGGPTTTRQAG